MKRSLTALLAVATLAVAAAAITAGTAGATVRSHAATNPSVVVVNGRCSKGSLSNLQLQREDTGQISVDFGVDMARHTAGVAWKVKETRNGVAFVNGTTRTIADGSFSISSLLSPKPVSHIVATASNPKTGETCSISASI